MGEFVLVRAIRDKSIGEEGGHVVDLILVADYLFDIARSYAAKADVPWNGWASVVLQVKRYYLALRHNLANILHLLIPPLPVGIATNITTFREVDQYLPPPLSPSEMVEGVPLRRPPHSVGVVDGSEIDICNELPPSYHFAFAVENLAMHNGSTAELSTSRPKVTLKDGEGPLRVTRVDRGHITNNLCRYESLHADRARHYYQPKYVTGACLHPSHTNGLLSSCKEEKYGVGSQVFKMGQGLVNFVAAKRSWVESRIVEYNGESASSHGNTGAKHNHGPGTKRQHTTTQTRASLTLINKRIHPMSDDLILGAGRYYLNTIHISLNSNAYSSNTNLASLSNSCPPKGNQGLVSSSVQHQNHVPADGPGSHLQDRSPAQITGPAHPSNSRLKTVKGFHNLQSRSSAFGPPINTSSTLISKVGSSVDTNSKPTSCPSRSLDSSAPMSSHSLRRSDDRVVIDEYTRLMYNISVREKIARQDSENGTALPRNDNDALIEIPGPKSKYPRWRFGEASSVPPPPLPPPPPYEEVIFREDLKPADIPHCSHILKGRCKQASRRDVECPDRIHFKRMMHAYTDIRLGDCSFLDSCDMMDRCPYVHYSTELPKGYLDMLAKKNKKSLQKGATGMETSAGDEVPMEAKIKGKASEESPPDKQQASSPSVPHPQWIKCDIRQLDLGLLGKFGAVMADPPWDIRMTLPYGTVPDQAIVDLPFKDLQDEGVFFLWCTARAIDTGHACLKAWGYEFSDEIAWVKVDHLNRLISVGRTGHWLNHTMEHCLVGIKGNPKWLRRGTDTDVIVSQPRATSHKPDEIYGLVERLVGPNVRKLELFGREHNIRPGWLTLGNQLTNTYIHEESLKKSLGKELARHASSYGYGPDWNPWTQGFTRYGYGEIQDWRVERKMIAQKISASRWGGREARGGNRGGSSMRGGKAESGNITTKQGSPPADFHKNAGDDGNHDHPIPFVGDGASDNNNGALETHGNLKDLQPITCEHGDGREESGEAKNDVKGLEEDSESVWESMESD